MARLPDLNDLGARPIPQSRQQFVPTEVSPVGQTLVKVADRAYTDRVNLARAQAANAALDYEIAIRTKADEVHDKVTAGDLNYNEARAAFDKDVEGIEKPSIQYLDPEGSLNLQKQLDRQRFTAGLQVDKTVDIARRTDFKDQFVGNLDRLGKLAGMPGADIEAINRQSEDFVPLAQKAGVPKDVIDHAVQNFKDQNWLNHANQRAMEGKDSLKAIKALEHDLTAGNGFYAGKLDTDKRNSVLRSVINDRLVLENRMQRAADKRDAHALITLNQMDQQFASGVPATPQMWTTWEAALKGTTYADEFKSRLDDEAKVQTVLRQPIEQQAKYLQDEQSRLDTQGGSIRDLANFNRLSRTIGANLKQLQTDPLVFNANRLGGEVTPVDLSKIGQPDTANLMTDRVSTITAMRKQYGEQVPMRPFLPQEVQQLSSVLEKATPTQQSQTLAALRNTIGTDEAFKGAMQQLAPDAPVKALAGMLAAKQRQLTLETHWFKPNDIATSGDVSATMLLGEQLLDPTKAAKGEDGKPAKNIYLPESQSLQAEFADQVGDAFANRPDAAQLAFRAMQAYYVGKASQTGLLAADKNAIDSTLVEEAVKATVGDATDLNGHTVLAPWGMDASTFEDHAIRAMSAAGKASGVSSASLVGASLRSYGEDTYRVLQGRNYVLDAKGVPLTIRIQP